MTKLSRCELEVLRLIANGFANREIAKELVISRPAVERHFSNIYAKIGARGRVDVAKYAYRKGQLELPSDPAAAGVERGEVAERR